MLIVDLTYLFYFRFLNVSVIISNFISRSCGKSNFVTIWKGNWWKHMWPNLRHCPIICLEGQKGITRTSFSIIAVPNEVRTDHLLNKIYQIQVKNIVFWPADSFGHPAWGMGWNLTILRRSEYF